MACARAEPARRIVSACELALTTNVATPAAHNATANSGRVGASIAMSTAIPATAAIGLSSMSRWRTVPATQEPMTAPSIWATNTTVSAAVLTFRCSRRSGAVAPTIVIAATVSALDAASCHGARPRPSFECCAKGRDASIAGRPQVRLKPRSRAAGGRASRHAGIAASPGADDGGSHRGSPGITAHRHACGPSGHRTRVA